MADVTREARGELTHLRAPLAGKKGSSDRDLAHMGRTRALQYLENATPKTIEALGEPLVAALLVAVGPTYFEVATEGRKLLKKELRTHDTERPTPAHRTPRDTDADDNHSALGGSLFDEDERDGAEEEAADRTLDDTVSESTDSVPAIDLTIFGKIEPHITYATSAKFVITDLGRSGNEESQAFLLRVLAIAVSLMEKDTLRKHLA